MKMMIKAMKSNPRVRSDSGQALETAIRAPMHQYKIQILSKIPSEDLQLVFIAMILIYLFFLKC